MGHNENDRRGRNSALGRSPAVLTGAVPNCGNRLRSPSIDESDIVVIPKTRSTTILTVRHKGRVAIGGDGQVSLGDTVVKADAVKIRPLAEGRVIAGFAGGAADAFALLERFEAKLKDYPANMPRAATELAKEWRTDRALRRLEAMIAVVDAQHTLLVSGTGDVIQPTDGILGIGSGGNFALAAAKALVAHSDLTAAQIVRIGLEIAGDISVYSNRNIVIEELPSSA